MTGGLTGRTAAGVAVLLAVVCAVPALVPRVSAELEPATVAVAVPESTLAGWTSADEGETEIAARLARHDIGTVVVGMTSIESLVRVGDGVTVAPRSQVPPGLKAGDGRSAGYLHGAPDDPNGDFARVVASLRAWYGERVSVAEESTPQGQVGYVRVDAVDRLGDVPVGYDQARLRALAERDVQVVLGLPARLSTGVGWLERQVAAAQEIGGARYVQALGELPFADAPPRRHQFASFLADRDLTLVLDDFADDSHAATYAEQLAGRFVRAHTIDVGPASDLRELRVRATRAIKERGVHLLVARSVTDAHDRAATPERFVELVERTNTAMPPTAELGAAPSAMTAVQPGTAARGAALAAAWLVVAAAGLRFLGLRVPLGRNRAWLVPRAVVGAGVALFTVLGAATWATAHPTLTSAVQLATAVAGSVLAVLVAVPGNPPATTDAAVDAAPGSAAGVGGWWWPLVRYGGGAAVATATGLVLAGLGSDSVFVVGAETFGGVRVLLLAPPVIVAAYGVATMLATPGGVRGLSILLRGLRPAHAVLAALLLAGVAYYLLRAGNYGLAPGFELRLRDWLDDALYIRPRFKEMLLGFPALLLAVSWRGVVGRWC